MFILKHFPHQPAIQPTGVQGFSAYCVKSFSVSPVQAQHGLTIIYTDTAGECHEFGVHNGESLIVENANGKTVDRIRPIGPNVGYSNGNADGAVG